jgi:hypothetical protein
MIYMKIKSGYELPNISKVVMAIITNPVAMEVSSFFGSSALPSSEAAVNVTGRKMWMIQEDFDGFNGDKHWGF